MSTIAMVHGADPSGKGRLVVSARRGLIVMLSMAFLYFSRGGRNEGSQEFSLEEGRRRTTGVGREVIGRRDGSWRRNAPANRGVLDIS